MLHQLIQIGIIISLCCLFYEDIKHRAISVWLLSVVFLLKALDVFLVQKSTYQWDQLFVNAIFIIVLVSCLFVYVAFRFKAPKEFFTTYFGWGDVFMFFNVSLYFLFVPFIAFMMISFVIALLYAMLTHLLLKKKLSVPLAGLQAMCLALLLVFDNLISDLGIFTMSFLP